MIDEQLDIPRRRWLTAGHEWSACAWWVNVDPAGYNRTTCNIDDKELIAWTMMRHCSITGFSVYVHVLPAVGETVESRIGYGDAGVTNYTATLSLVNPNHIAFVTWNEGLYPVSAGQWVWVEMRSLVGTTARNFEWVVEVTL